MTDYKLLILGFLAFSSGTGLTITFNSFYPTAGCDTYGYQFTGTHLIEPLLYTILASMLMFGGVIMLHYYNKKSEKKISNVLLWFMVFVGVMFLLFFIQTYSYYLCGTSCIAVNGYLCQNPIMMSSNVDNIPYNSLLSFQFSQNYGDPIYNVYLSCAARGDVNGMPYTAGISYGGSSVPDAFFRINTTTGNVIPSSPMSALSSLPVIPNSILYSGEVLNVSNLPCYNLNGSVIGYNSSIPIGTGFIGNIWIAYSTTPDGNATTYAKILLTLSVKQSYSFR